MTDARPATQIDTSTDTPRQRIAPLPMFHTPTTMAELERTAETYTGPEGVAFTMGMCLAWNLAAHITAGNDQLDKAEAEAQPVELHAVVADHPDRPHAPYSVTFSNAAAATRYARRIARAGYTIEHFTEFMAHYDDTAATREAATFFDDPAILDEADRADLTAGPRYPDEAEQ